MSQATKPTPEQCIAEFRKAATSGTATIKTTRQTWYAAYASLTLHRDTVTAKERGQKRTFLGVPVVLDETVPAGEAQA